MLALNPEGGDRGTEYRFLCTASLYISLAVYGLVHSSGWAESGKFLGDMQSVNHFIAGSYRAAWVKRFSRGSKSETLHNPAILFAMAVGDFHVSLVPNHRFSQTTDHT